MNNANHTPQLGKSSVEEVIAAMSIEEKVNLLVGTDENYPGMGATVGLTEKILPGAAGTTYAIPRLGIPSIVMADGPAGLRIAPKRENDERRYYCTAFPVETSLSSTWDTALAEKVGKAMGNEAKEYGADILLAPAVNIHRNPLNGRNYEYYSEDPLLAGFIGAAMVKGVQKEKVGVSLKHFALNNQETNRMLSNSIVSPRAQREIYLRPFEIIVKEALPWTVMTSYNKLNGTYTSERADLLTTVLRDEWGFEGVVMTDWYGGTNPLEQIEAGNDLLMPGNDKQRADLLQGVNEGRISLRDIDRSVKAILELIMKSLRFDHSEFSGQPDLQKHGEISRLAASEGMVLLKNEAQTLPVNRQVKKAAVFGIASYDLIVGGTGSGDVNRAYTVSLVEGLKNKGIEADRDLQLFYEDYIAKESVGIAEKAASRDWWYPKEKMQEILPAKKELERLCEKDDIAIITIGRSSGEFFDRKITGDFTLTEVEQQLIDNVCTAFQGKGKKVIVILNISGVVETDSWKSKPDAILVAWMPGQEGGNAIADVLTGEINPSGKLPMTFPLKYEDVPSALNFPDTDKITDKEMEDTIYLKRKSKNKKNIDYTVYEEDIYVGYRYYDSFGKAVSFPFGFGLSYTDFEFAKFQVRRSNDHLMVKGEIKNIGHTAGKEVFQIYVSAPAKTMGKPDKELKAFIKTGLLAPGESEKIKFAIPIEALGSFNENSSCWEVEEGDYIFYAGNSSGNLPLKEIVNIKTGYSESIHNVLLPQSAIDKLTRRSNN